MKKTAITICAGIMALNVMAAFSGCQSNDTKKDTSKQEETQKEQKAEKPEEQNEPEDKGTKNAGIEYTMTAVCLTDDNGGNLFVELATEMPFYSTIPEGELYDEEGRKISTEDLNNGDVLEITGNGLIAESYPAQYHGIFKMQRVEKENKEYADKYQGLLEQFTFKADPKEVPYLDISYRQPEAIVTAAVKTGGYTWSYEKENGETETIEADSADILDWQWEENDEMKISGSTEMELLFSKKPEKAEVVEYRASDLAKEGAHPEGAKDIEIKENQEGNFVMTAEPDSVYRVTAYWENGEAQYGFRTASIQNRQ